MIQVSRLTDEPESRLRRETDGFKHGGAALGVVEPRNPPPEPDSKFESAVTQRRS